LQSQSYLIQEQKYSHTANWLTLELSKVLISPIICTGLPSKTDDSVDSHSFFSSLVFVIAASCICEKENI
jgi:hypothetical protein